MSEDAAPVGRPEDYKPEYVKQAYKLSLLGLTDKELGDYFECCEATINNWKKRYPEFLASIKRGKESADSKVASRLYQRALGFEHDSEEIKVVSRGEGMGSEVERVPVRKIYPPDTTAAIFWLKNRQPKFWRDKQEVEHSGEVIQWLETKTYDPEQKTDAGA